MSRNTISRRALCKMGLAVAAGLALPDAASAAPALDRFAAPQTINPRQHVLLKGGTIISLDPQVGNLATGDVLIEGRTIAAIGQNLSAAGARVIDAANRIIIPGFVDCHRYSWEGQLRRINPNARTIGEYANATHLSFATHYRPQDTYVGNLLTAFGCIDSGITLRHRQFAQFTQRRPFRRRGRGADRFRHTRGSRFGRAAGRDLGHAMAAGLGAAEGQVFP